MQKRVWLWLVVVSLLVFGCGASAQQLATMRNARYRISGSSLLAIAGLSIQSSYQIVVWRPNDDLNFLTAAHWYTPDGLRSNLRSDSHHPGSVKLAFVVSTTDDATGSMLTVTPIAFMHDANAVKLWPLAPGRADWLPWIDGKTDALVEAIYHATQSYVVAPTTNATGTPGPAAGSATPSY